MKLLRDMLASCAAGGPLISLAVLAGGALKSEAPVLLTCDLPGNVVGTSRIDHAKHVITARVSTTGLRASLAVTLWII